MESGKKNLKTFTFQSPLWIILIMSSNLKSHCEHNSADGQHHSSDAYSDPSTCTGLLLHWMFIQSTFFLTYVHLQQGKQVLASWVSNADVFPLHLKLSALQTIFHPSTEWWGSITKKWEHKTRKEQMFIRHMNGHFSFTSIL